MATSTKNNDAVPAAAPEALALTFKDITYTVKPKKRPAKTILHGLSGVCTPGKVLAIMGPSGAGKTSLLDVLAGRVQAVGDIALGAKKHAAPHDISQRAAYVQQDDAIMASQTTREALQMAADLTLPAGTSRAQRVSLVDTLIDTFHLHSAADTIVGDPLGRLKGISGGERKRLAVAMSAVRSPRLIFLDEPTSGLDAHKAFVLVKTLKDFAIAKTSTVVCTVHQPSSDIFALFDDLLLLLNGRSVFYGPAASTVDHFGSIGFPCPQYANPADFLFMHVLSTSEGAAVDGERALSLASAWDASPLKAQADAHVADAMPASPRRENGAILLPSRASRAPIGLQFVTLLKRAANDVRRNPLRGKAQVAQSCAFALIITLVWFQVSNDQNGVQDRAGCLFFVAANGMMTAVLGTLTTFANERAAVMREQENGMYHSLPYFAARVIIDFPARTVAPCIFMSIAYWTVGYRADAAAYGSALLTVVLLAYASNSLGIFLACLFPDISIALLAAPLIMLPFMMFSGFFLNAESTPSYLIWLEWLSPMKYAFSALVLNEFQGLELYCKPDQLRFIQPEGGGDVMAICPVPNGDVFIDALNIQGWLTVSVCQLFLVIEMVAWTVLAYLALVLTTRAAISKGRPKAPPKAQDPGQGKRAQGEEV